MFESFLDFIVPFSGAMLGAVSQGILWGIMALGVYITFKILDFADMTVDGSFALGGCTCALLIVSGVNPLIAVLVATVAGSIAGLLTGVLTTKLKIPGILAGILVQLALYSINLHVLGGPNQPLSRANKTVVNWVNNALNLGDVFPVSATSIASLIVGIIYTAVIIAILYWFFGTEIGSAIRATGDNGAMSRAQGINTDSMQILALMIANGLVALSGALVMQQQRFGDVSMGIGTIVIGLASIIIGEVIFGKRFGFWWSLLGVVFGSIIYRVIIAIVLQMGMKTQDLKLLSAVVVAVALSVPVLKQKYGKKKAVSKAA
ncbi:ABC transporter permease subunit [Treponema sp.]|uniref:ABC transporter permease n=1 Tax=Treponema sp. TaxID=166 RepID=UPI001E0D0049|nr:ABC transporter permease [Treponema sp.]MBS7241696.1 ABC transporter permease [Treponema sp.]MCI6441891.1 ABC transporter permease [Spirochaetia bacterium]MDY4133148.1 ABC transporter permease [Treponema sp.]